MSNLKTSKSNDFLDALVQRGDILSYEFFKNYQEPGRDILTTETLTIKFPSGNSLTLDTFCSGCMENTGFHIGTAFNDGKENNII